MLTLTVLAYHELARSGQLRYAMEEHPQLFADVSYLHKTLGWERYSVTRVGMCEPGDRYQISRHGQLVCTLTILKYNPVLYRYIHDRLYVTSVLDQDKVKIIETKKGRQRILTIYKYNNGDDDTNAVIINMDEKRVYLKDVPTEYKECMDTSCDARDSVVRSSDLKVVVSI